MSNLWGETAASEPKGRTGGTLRRFHADRIVVAHFSEQLGIVLDLSAMRALDIDAKQRVAWAQTGAPRAEYEKVVRPILDQRCMACHDGSNPHLPNLNGYDHLKKVTEKDTGATVATLVRVSHIHLFGVTFIFFLVGLMFTHAYVRPVWLKCTIIAFPFLAIMVDVSSWYIIKLFHPFVFVEMSAGMLMAACFGIMWLVTMYQLWFSATPQKVAERKGGSGVAVAVD